MTTSATQTTRSLLTRTRDHRTTRKGRLLVALPEPNLSEPQDAEWCVVQVEGKWRRVRFHDYAELFSIPGLYEKVIYEIFGVRFPAGGVRSVESRVGSTAAGRRFPAGD
jgi:hypothetical protein